MHLVLLLFALFASLFTFQKETLQYTEPFFLIGARMTFAGFLLLAYEAAFNFKKFKNLKNFKFKASHIAPLVMLAIANIYLTNIFEIWGLSNMDSSKACLLYSLSPFLAALVAFFVLKEKLSKKKWLGMLVGFIGLIPILYTQTETEIATGKIFIFTFAEIAMVGAVLFSVYGWILLKKVISVHNFTPIMANGVSMTLGGLLALCHSYLSGENWQPIPVNNLSAFVGYSLIMCLISNIICYNLYGYLLKRFTATFMSFSGLVTPLFASLFGYFFLNEQIGVFYFIAVGFFAVGLTIFYLEEIKQEKTLKVKKQLQEELGAV